MMTISIIYKGIRKIHRTIIGSFYTPIGKIKFKLNGANFKDGLKVKGPLKLNITRRGELTIGKDCRFNSGQNYNVSGGNQRCHFWIDGKLTMGNNVGISSSSILCRHEINIGNHVKIGGNTLIIDTDAHSTNPKERTTSVSKDSKKANWGPVTISDFVFIGTRCIILKGVTIGKNSIVAAGSIVTKNIPANEIWGGNPAKKIRSI
ncbi:acyltransferase [Cellulophaga baltica]|uniref:Acyltransferase n=1 Tax=Cellulophaga baltica 18 TaxID=1348584 RepID=A0AAU8RIK8_9FLAO|nr:acyltransferase [Cellulophaga baltica]AIZ40713.1 hypothetical protein M666_03455 [Cellulophaga baltica 18]WFO15298.1 acyltransferase [Cellulophaga baltica 4]